jgi:hypothetical protein
MSQIQHGKGTLLIWLQYGKGIQILRPKTNTAAPTIVVGEIAHSDLYVAIESRMPGLGRGDNNRLPAKEGCKILVSKAKGENGKRT